MKTFFSVLVSILLLTGYVNGQSIATVGGSGADYPTLKLAFDAINSGILNGHIVLQITGSTIEPSCAYLNESGTGNTNFTTVTIYPTASGLSVSGNFSDPTIDLRGADNVTIDGRVNLSGSTASLLISNSSTNSLAAALRFITSAENNLVRYCNLQSSCYDNGRGMIVFASSNTGNGNDNNIIEYCNITNSGSRPIVAIFSSGSSGRENSGNIIRYNNIYDFFTPNSTCYGILLSFQTTDWIIKGNSFYETTSLSPAGAYKYYPININTGNNHIISDNYFGGSGPQCSGTFTINAMVPYYFSAICMNGGTAGYIQNNVISKFNCISSEDNPWDGMLINSGNVDVTGNTIGSGTGTNSIIVSTPVAVATATISGGVVTGLTLLDGGSGYSGTPVVTFSSAGSTTPATASATMSGGVITGLTLLTGGAGYTSTPNVIFDGQSNNYSTTHAIIQNSSGIVNIIGNTIGSITTVGSDYYSHGFETVYVRGTSSTTTLSNNLIGSTSTANSINVSSAAANSLIKQDLYGLYSANNGSTIISGNTIANLTNAYQGLNSGSKCRGINTTSGQNTILNNTVRDIVVSSGQSTSGPSASLIGISQTSSTIGQTISGNEVYNLSNINTGDVKVDVYGIYFSGPTSGTNNIDGNFVHSISIASANYLSAMMGIRLYGGNSTFANNIVNIGNPSTLGYRLIGIWDEIGLIDCYFNTVYIGGSVSTVSTGKTDNTAGLWNNSNTNPRNYRNNIFVNARSGGTTGHHYAIHIAGLANVTIDYNNYYVSGTGGVFGQISWQDKTDLGTWKLATGQDENSLNIDPDFTLSGGTNSSDFITSASLPGVTGTGILTDYESITRNNPPKMGALESSLSFVWQGNTSTDFATATNWENGTVPTDGADISFAATPANDCYLDQNRTIKNITNTSAKKLVINAKQLTLTGSIVSGTANQIDATATSSVVIFAGTDVQVIPSGVFMSNTIDALTLSNSAGLTQSGDISVQALMTLSNGTYSIGANTLTINGSLMLTSGILRGGSSSNIVVDGSGVSITLPGITLHDLTLDRVNGITMGGSVNVAGTLALTEGVITLGANTLTISGNSLTRVNGQIDASHPSATLELTNSSPITCPGSIIAGDINNFTINGAGISACCSCTINGVLNLQSANPSATKGTLDMGSNILTMGANATTTGIGDVTGIVKREHTFNSNTEYTFGSQYTTFSFIDANTKPTWISVQISLGAVPGWDPWDPTPNGKVKRLYKLSCSDNSSTSQANIDMRYLLSELDATYNDESKLVFWHKKTAYAGGLPHEHGKSNQDFVNHFIGVTGLTFGAAVTTNLDDSQVAIAYSVATKNTWKGEAGGHETEWEDPNNWTTGLVPLSTEDVLIPGGLTYYPSLTSSANAVAQSIEIESGASISANSYNITVSGAGGAWINQGTFIAGTGKVLFNHGVPTEIVTVAGTTNFYDIEVGANTTMQPAHGSILRISGTGSADISSQIDFSAINNTVEWNGANQTIVNPTGIGGNSGYFNLILSGSGTKTMPETDLSIHGDFNLSGSANVTAGSAITIEGNFTIGEESYFNTGSFNHNIGGDFDNNGTLTVPSGNEITMNGSASQSILSTSAINFYDLSIDNSHGVQLYAELYVNNELSLAEGNFNIGSDILGINGVLNKGDGNLAVSQQSSLSFGGSGLITLPDNLFSGIPSIKNLSINRSGGVALGNQNITINGVLSLTNGVLDPVANSLIIAGTSPIRTNGSIDATDPYSSILFSNNEDAITLPQALFTGNISNLTINGSAGVTSLGDLTVEGLLSLLSENPAEIAGCLDMKDGSVLKTLTMGANATTSGIGDVTGIIKRTSFAANTVYTFGNQFTTVVFNEGGTYPTGLSVSVSIGAAPSWKPTAINRIYDFVQTGGSDCYANVATHYLESELNGNDENELVQWTSADPATPPYDLYEWGRSGANMIENWIQISNVNISNFPTSAGNLENTLSASEIDTYTWNGSQSSDWTTIENWTPNGSPSSASNVIIPDASTTLNSPSLPATAEVDNLTIETVGVLNAVPGAKLTIHGGNGALTNSGGTFFPGSSTLTFTHPGATYVGTTNIYNLTIYPGASLTMSDGSNLRIAGSVTNTDAAWKTSNAGATTVEYNGGDQDIVVPDQATSRYSSLIISGTGTKTMPAADLGIQGDLTISGPVNVNLYHGLSINGDLSISTSGGGAFIANGGATISIEGETQLNSPTCLVLKSNSSETASFINNGSISGIGTALIERYLAPYDQVSDSKFHFISSPVGNNQAIEPAFINLLSPDITDFYKWDETSNLWINFRGSAFNERNEDFGDSFHFVAGKGYLVAYPQAITKNFIGMPYSNTSGLTINCTNTSDGGWNLVGNPFPSSIDWNLVARGNGMDAALYYYDNATSSYRYYTNLSGGLGDATQYIAPMQGFMVHANMSEPKTITISNTARTHEGQNVFYKDAPLITNLLNLKVEGNGMTDYARVCFYDQASTAFDGAFDALKLFSYNGSAPQLYTLASDMKPLSISTLPLSELAGTVDLYFKPGTPGSFTLSALNTESFAMNAILTLEDLKTGIHKNLKPYQVYTFESSLTDDPLRFKLHFAGPSGLTETGVNNLNVFASNGNLYIDNEIEGAVYTLCNMTGQIVISGVLQDRGRTTISVQNLKDGIYVFSLCNNQQKETRKIMIKNP